MPVGYPVEAPEGERGVEKDGGGPEGVAPVGSAGRSGRVEGHFEISGVGLSCNRPEGPPILQDRSTMGPIRDNLERAGERQRLFRSVFYCKFKRYSFNMNDSLYKRERCHFLLDRKS